MSEASVDQVVSEIVRSLNQAHGRRSRGLVVVRCTGPREVDHARETLIRATANFKWKSLPAAELDPPDLLGYVLQFGKPEGPCYLTYGLPKGTDGRVLKRFVELITVAGRKYVMSPYLLVLLLTLDEIRDLNKGGPPLLEEPRSVSGLAHPGRDLAVPPGAGRRGAAGATQGRRGARRWWRADRGRRRSRRPSDDGLLRQPVDGRLGAQRRGLHAGSLGWCAVQRGR